MTTKTMVVLMILMAVALGSIVLAAKVALYFFRLIREDVLDRF